MREGGTGEGCHAIGELSTDHTPKRASYIAGYICIYSPSTPSVLRHGNGMNMTGQRVSYGSCGVVAGRGGGERIGASERL